MRYSGPERRQNQRIHGRFIVSYRILEDASVVDITQTKNISLGGMLLTTNREFSRGTKLGIEIRLPFDPNPIMLLAVVQDSKEIAAGLIYDTRLQFLSIDQKHIDSISQTVAHYLKKEKNEKN